MDYALGAAFFYAWSVTCARRSSAHHGPDLANLGRLLVAIVIVGLFVAFSGRHPFSAGWGWLLLGGVLGLGVGDIALFHALPRIGVGLTMLLTQCLAAPIALFLEYEILGLSPNGPQLLSALVILAGVGVALGAQRETFMGLAGLGDLVLTCTDDQSRNRRFGLLLAAGTSVDAALAQIGQVVEGYLAAKAVRRVAQREGVEMPICEGIYRLLYENLPPQEVVKALMSRPIKAEFSR